MISTILNAFRVADIRKKLAFTAIMLALYRLGAFIPVPGGICVVEFALEVGLTSAGMTPSAALATVVLYRIAPFYLPPVWGFFALRWLQRGVAADELVVDQSPIAQRDRAPGFHPDACAERQGRPQHQRIEQVSFQADVLRDGPVVVGTGQRRDEVHLAGRSALEEAAARNLYDHVEFWHHAPLLSYA